MVCPTPPTLPSHPSCNNLTTITKTTEFFTFPFPRAVLHDPELYPEPSTFNPERFLSTPAEPQTTTTATTTGTHQPRLNDPQLISLAFGAGKRICPGRHFVDASLFILAASVLAVFNLSKPPSVAEAVAEAQDPTRTGGGGGEPPEGANLKESGLVL